MFKQITLAFVLFVLAGSALAPPASAEQLHANVSPGILLTSGPPSR
jgi:hypothetical protein